MARDDLEKRVAELEAEVARLRLIVEKSPEPVVSWVEKIAGKYANDPVFDEAMRLGKEYRESLRPKPRRRNKV